MSAHARILGIAVVGLLLPAAAGAVNFDDLDKGSAMERIQTFEKMIGTEKDSVELFFRLGNAYFDAEMADMATTFYRRSLKAGGDMKVLMNLTYVLDDLGDREAEAEAFQEGLRRWPKDPLVHAFYADFLSSDADSLAGIEAAVGEYRQALALDDKCVEAHFGLGILFAKAGIYKDAIREWERVSEIDGQHRLARQAKQNIEKIKKEKGR